MRYLLPVLLLMMTQQVRAEDDSSRDPASSRFAETDKQEQDIAQRAKGRMYSGGPDESDLKVQAALVAPTRKLAPTIADDGSDSPAADD